MLINSEELLQQVESLKAQLANKDIIINLLQEKIDFLKVAKFSRKTDKYNPNQMDLFDEADAPVLEEEIIDDIEIEEQTTDVKKKKSGRKSLPKNLPYVEKIHDLPESEQICSCGCKLTVIGDERSEQLEVIPKTTYKIINIKKKYACKSCSDTIKTAVLPKQPIAKSIATPGLLSSIITSKFCYHMPLYRQEDFFAKAGVPITRSSFSNWMIKVGNLL